MTRPDRKLAAAAILLGGIGLISIQDAFIKHLVGGYPFHQMQTIRSGLALALIFLLLTVRGELHLLRSSNPRLLAIRSFTLALASSLFYLGLAAIPMADSSAIYFALPLMVAALSGVLVGEHVQAYRWIAAAAGFAGVIITIGPGTTIFEPASLLSLVASLLYAVGHMLARPLGDRESISTMAFYQCVAFLAVALILAAIFGTGLIASDAHVSLRYLTGAWIMPTTSDLAILAFTGLTAAFGMYIWTASYRLAAPSFIAPFEYSMLLWSIVMGFLFFGDIPKSTTLYGAGLIVAAGLFLIWYERRSNPKLAAQAASE